MCRHPLYAVKYGYNRETGKSLMKIHRRVTDNYNDLCHVYGIRNVVSLPCGKCDECLADKGRNWAARCMLEAGQYKDNCFITLTYDNQHLLNKTNFKRDFQLFMKRIRKDNPDIRYFACFELGAHTLRPHFHAIMFNYFPKDARLVSRARYGGAVYDSSSLDRYWKNGHTDVGLVSFKSAGYVARYCMKQLHNIPGLPKEFILMSRRPGLGANYFKLYKEHIYKYDLIVNKDIGKALKPPRYFDKLMGNIDPFLLDEIKRNRIATSAIRESADKLSHGISRHEEINKFNSIHHIERLKRLKRDEM